MKQIQKGNECQALIDWRRANAAVPQNLVYGKAGFPGEEVLSSLLIEQGYLCGYTLKIVDSTSAHIEHIKPQTICRDEDGLREIAGLPRHHHDISWKNMVACFPSPNQKAPPGYGADKKGGWWPAVGYKGFVSPLDHDCEQRFSFGVDGSVSPTCEVSKETIDKLALDDSRLQELRREAMIRAGLHPRSPRLLMSAANVKKMIAEWSNRDREGKYKEFCVPLKVVALQHLARIEGRTRGVVA